MVSILSNLSTPHFLVSDNTGSVTGFGGVARQPIQQNLPQKVAAALELHSANAAMDDFLNPAPAPAPQPPPPTPPITPTQTVSAHHLGQKGDILSLFGPSSTTATPAPPSNPSSPIGDFEGGLAPPAHSSLILSNSFTEPGPMELDPLGDMFGDGEKPAAAVESPQPTFYIDETDSAKKELESNVGEEPAKVDETVKEGATTPAPQQQTSRFWSWWSRSKSEAGSKENILDDGEKKPGEEGERLLVHLPQYSDKKERYRSTDKLTTSPPEEKWQVYLQPKVAWLVPFS